MSKNRNLSGGLFTYGKPKPLTIKEAPLSGQIVDWLDGRGIYNDRLQCGQFQTPSGNWMKGSKTGTPDRFAIICGQIIFIEIKMFGKKPTFEQVRKHEELRRHGAIVITCDSFDYFVREFSAIRAGIYDSGKEMNFYE